jgi:hypothetical protein
MPTRSREGTPLRALEDLGLPARAVTALTRAGITSIDDLGVLTRRELTAVNGLGPGMIAAIRLVVPEPPSGPPATLAPGGHPAAEEESPDAPAIPSFDSLRSGQRRGALDLLIPTADPAEPPEPAPNAPRPATYADLQRIVVHVAGHLARAAAGLPVRAVRWSVREPARCLRWLLG